jgi:hypothetical protein
VISISASYSGVPGYNPSCKAVQSNAGQLNMWQRRMMGKLHGPETQQSVWKVGNNQELFNRIQAAFFSELKFLK